MSTTPQYRAITRALAATGGGRTALDGCGDPKTKPAMDGVTLGAAAATYAQQNIRVQAASAVQVWADAESAPMDAGEGSGDRIAALLVSIADANQSGELNEAEQAIYLDACTAAWEYMAGLGVSEEELDALFNSDDPDVANAAGDRIITILADALPSGEDASLADMDEFAFGDPDVTLAALDAAYSKRVVFRGGKKVVMKKRISGTVHLTAKQRIAIHKMQAKSHGAKANMGRKKSLNARRAAGL